MDHYNSIYDWKRNLLQFIQMTRRECSKNKLHISSFGSWLRIFIGKLIKFHWSSFHQIESDENNIFFSLLLFIVGPDIFILLILVIVYSDINFGIIKIMMLVSPPIFDCCCYWYSWFLIVLLIVSFLLNGLLLTGIYSVVSGIRSHWLLLSSFCKE